MQVILMENITSLGKEGQIIRVADGYARNFLLPRGKALEATPTNIAFWEKKKDQLRAKQERKKVEALELAEKIESETYSIKRKVGKNNKLYGSITASDIIGCLKAKGINLERKNIKLTESIKTLGEYSATIKLHPEVTATARIQIVKDE